VVSVHSSSHALENAGIAINPVDNVPLARSRPGMGRSRASPRRLLPTGARHKPNRQAMPTSWEWPAAIPATKAEAAALDLPEELVARHRQHRFRLDTITGSSDPSWSRAPRLLTGPISVGAVFTRFRCACSPRSASACARTRGAPSALPQARPRGHVSPAGSAARQGRPSSRPALWPGREFGRRSSLLEAGPATCRRCCTTPL
jgi:hypothetical protein